MLGPVELGALIQLCAATELSALEHESANLTRESKVFAHIRSPARRHFAYTDISSLPHSVFLLSFMHHRVAQAASIHGDTKFAGLRREELARGEWTVAGQGPFDLDKALDLLTLQ
jgi:hypothetical protein